MNRSTYLADFHVAGFVHWMATELDTSLFQHAYIDRRSGKEWNCTSLFNAFEKYQWNHPGNQRLAFNSGSTFLSNAKALAALKADLAAAGTDDSKVVEAASGVMAWGGVTARNNEWLKLNQAGLARSLQAVQAAINAGDPEAPALRCDQLRFNSGMTKVYSLLCDDFVIYDSRVAASLGWLIVKYCDAKSLASVPSSLCFPWAAAKEAQSAVSPKRRDPGAGPYKFKRLRSGSHHALWNMRASWTLAAVLAHPKASGCGFHGIVEPKDSLRALEAALFMIGYDLGQ
jgi:hypothetical protein